MKKIFLSFFILLFFSGCGYTTHSVATSLEGATTIFVPTFKNNVDFNAERRDKSLYIPLMEVQITNKLIDRFVFDGNLRIAKQEQADLILEGALLNYRRDPLRYNDDDDAEEYRISIVVSLKLLDLRNGNIIWEETSFVGDTTYFPTGPNAKSESTAIDEAVKDLAKRIFTRLGEAEAARIREEVLTGP